MLAAHQIPVRNLNPESGIRSNVARRPATSIRLRLVAAAAVCFARARRRAPKPSRAEASALITAPRQDFEALQLPLSTGLVQLPDIDLPLFETEPV